MLLTSPFGNHHAVPPLISATKSLLPYPHQRLVSGLLHLAWRRRPLSVLVPVFGRRPSARYEYRLWIADGLNVDHVRFFAADPALHDATACRRALFASFSALRAAASRASSSTSPTR